MPKYRVYFNTVAECSVEVEAKDEEHAIDQAYENGLPYASFTDGFEIGDWTSPSALFPQWNKPEDDVEEIS